ncbi:MAG: hypothetical protein KAS23_02310 [Anaerohalosphaera sp.]|nr:hypothetical protein [Anaerohalosphaera sp.]
MAEKKYKLRLIKQVLIILAVCIFVKIVVFKPRPNIAIDYMATFNELTKPENYDPSQNCADILKQALDDYTEMQAELWWVMVFNNDDLLIMPSDLDPVLSSQLSVWLDSNQSASASVKKVSEKKIYWEELSRSDNNVDLALYPNLLSTYQLISKASLWRIKVEAIYNPEVIINVTQNLRMAEIFANTGSRTDMLLAQNIRVQSYGAIRCLLKHKVVESEILAQLQQYLEDNKPQVAYEKMCATEKLVAFDRFQRIYTDDGKGDGKIIPSQYKKVVLNGRGTGRGESLSLFEKLKNIPRNLRSEIELSKYLANECETRKEAEDKVSEVYDKASKIFKLTPYQMKAQETSYKHELLMICWPPQDYPMVSNFFLSIDYLIDLIHIIECEHYATAAVLAIFRYKSDHETFPETLVKLVETGYLKSLPMDPYSDGPLVYGRTENGFVLYSLGADFDDDNGKGEHNWRSKDGDYVFWPVPDPKKIEPLPIPETPLYNLSFQ